MQRSSSCLFLLWAIVNPRQSDTHGFMSSNLMNKNRFINMMMILICYLKNHYVQYSLFFIINDQKSQIHDLCRHNCCLCLC